MNSVRSSTMLGPIGRVMGNIMRTCKTCDKSLPLSNFYERNGYPQKDCKDCVKAQRREEYKVKAEQKRAYQRTYRAADPERTAEHNRRYRFKSRYGITPQQYDEVLDSQNGVCKVCDRPCPTGERLTVDHDHLTGAVRGLLCRNCNAGLGNFKDDPELLERALQYLSGEGG